MYSHDGIPKVATALLYRESRRPCGRVPPMYDTGQPEKRRRSQPSPRLIVPPPSRRQSRSICPGRKTIQSESTWQRSSLNLVGRLRAFRLSFFVLLFFIVGCVRPRVSVDPFGWCFGGYVSTMSSRQESRRRFVFRGGGTSASPKYAPK